MNTRLAAQVFSTSVTRVLSSYGPADAARAANFCLVFNKYFVTMNVSCTAASSLEQMYLNILSFHILLLNGINLMLILKMLNLTCVLEILYSKLVGQTKIQFSRFLIHWELNF